MLGDEVLSSADVLLLKGSQKLQNVIDISNIIR